MNYIKRFLHSKWKILLISVTIFFFFLLFIVPKFGQQFDNNLLIIRLIFFSQYFIFFIIVNSFDSNGLRPNSPIKRDTKILDLSNTSNRKSEEHNSALVPILLSYVAIDASQINEQNKIIIQVRLFYAVILAGLVSFLYSNQKPLIALFILIIILIMYLQEVHLKDLLKRTEICFFIKCSAVEQLTSMKPKNKERYTLTYDSLLDQEANASVKRWRRKFFAACNPNIEQIIFYCIPWLGISSYLIYLIAI